MTDTAVQKPEQADKSRAQRAFEWWAAMQPARDEGISNPNSDPGALARLRRCSTPLDALTESATLRLCRLMGCKSTDTLLIENVAVLAMTLAHVRENKTGQTLGEMLGAKPESKDAPLMSDLRLRQLFAARDAAEMVRGFRMAIALLGGRAPVLDLCRIVLDWNHPERGDRIRIRFLFDYHGASDAAPPQPDSFTPDAA